MNTKCTRREGMVMSIGEGGYIFTKYFIVTVSILTSIYGGYWVYYAFVQTKDEQEKSLVCYTAAKAFGVTALLFFLYYLLQLIVKAANVKQLTRLWQILHFGSRDEFSVGMALSIMMVVLGVFLLVEKRNIHLR